mgnify:FL=1
MCMAACIELCGTGDTSSSIVKSIMPCVSGVNSAKFYFIYWKSYRGIKSQFGNGKDVIGKDDMTCERMATSWPCYNNEQFVSTCNGYKKRGAIKSLKSWTAAPSVESFNVLVIVVQWTMCDGLEKMAYLIPIECPKPTVLSFWLGFWRSICYSTVFHQ